MNIKKYKAISKKLIDGGEKTILLNKSLTETTVKANNIRNRQILRHSIIEKRIKKGDWSALKNNTLKNINEY